MGILEWLFGKNEKREESTAANVTFSVRLETKTVEAPPVAHEDFSGEIAGAAVRAEVPVEAKTECERLLRKSDRSDADNTYLHDNYWVNVYYKNERHAYHGVNDFWTYSARDLPELPLLHDWIYSILGKKKPQINENISTVKTWEEKGTIHALGGYGSIRVQVSFKPRGHVLAFVLNDEFRWEDKASYNTKTGQAHFPFYYSEAQAKIIEWGRIAFEKKKQQAKGA